MKSVYRKWTALLLTLCMLFSLAPAAFAAETGAPEIPGFTQYTGTELDTSKYYLAVTVDSDGNLYALYLNQAGTQVNSGGLTGANGACTAALTVADGAVTASYLADGTALDVEDLLLTVNTIDNGYTFRSGDLYLALANNMFSAGYTALSVSVSDGAYTISNSSANRVLSFNRVGDGLSDYPDEKYITDFWGPRAATGFSIYLYTQDEAVAPVDKGLLQSAIASASALEEADYTAATWAALQEALVEAQTVFNDSAATQEEVNAATEALNDAMDSLALVVTPPDDLPTVTQYVEDTDGVDAGAVYAILYDGSSNGSLLYHNGTGSQTDQIGGSVSSGILSIASGSNWTDENVLWTVEAVEGGYTLRNVDTGYYLNLSAANSRAQVSAEPSTVEVAAEEGHYTITNGTLALCHDTTGQYYIAEGSGTSLRFFKQTETTVTDMAPGAISGTSEGQPFVMDDTGTSAFRIPSVVTLDNGWIVATCDIRWRTEADSPQNLDTIVSISKDGGENWEWEVVNYFDDMADSATAQTSASFIDPSVVQASDGTVHMVVDACPSYAGLMSGNRMGWESDGFDEQGRMLVALAQSGGDAPTAVSAYAYYVDINNSAAGQEKAVNGSAVTLYPICQASNGAESGYYVDAFLDLYYERDGVVEPVYTTQLSSSYLVQSNLFYRNSQWKAYPVFYIMHRSATVTEDGLVWGEPQFLNIKIAESEAFTGVCPGRGTVTTLSDGTERILFPLYDNQTGTELASAIYSDDGGKTWTRSARANQLNGTGKSSESQIIVLPDGTLRMFSRNTVNYISYTDSTDGGETWGQYQQDKELYSQNPGNGCMVSFINLEGVLTGPDGQTYENLVLASYPVVQRKEGVVRIGSIDAETNQITWLNDDDSRFTGARSFAYSCVTQLAELDTFGVLYEYSPTTGTIDFATLTVTDLLGEGWTLTKEVTPEEAGLSVSVTGPTGVSAVPAWNHYTFSLEGEKSVDTIQLTFTVRYGEGVVDSQTMTALNDFVYDTQLVKSTVNSDGSTTYTVILFYDPAQDAPTLPVDAFQLGLRTTGTLGSATVILNEASFASDGVYQGPAALGDTTVVTQVMADRYDLNGDGSVDVGDVSLVRRYYQVGRDSDEWTSASVCDLNGDGLVDMEDLILIGQAALNN